MNIEKLIEQENKLQVTPFTHNAAWEIAGIIKEKVRIEQLKPVGIQVVYHHKTVLRFLSEGRKESPWLERKVKTVLESQHSSLYTFLKVQQNGEFKDWLQDEHYAVCGGGFPIIEDGSVVGAICVSGLEHMEDHRLIVEAIATYMGQTTGDINQQKEKIIKDWFYSWFNPRWNNFDKVFNHEVYYSESWGPEYQGIHQVKQWFTTWHTKMKLLDWVILTVNHIDDQSFIEWRFSCADDKKSSVFDGMTMILWDENMKIISLKEFASSLPKYNPLKDK